MKSTMTTVAAFVVLVLARQASAAPIFFTGTESHYDFVSDSVITWTDAKVAAESLSFLGNPGHLVTITSAAEDAFLHANFSGVDRAWMGASDAAVEGEWRWATGPEGLADGGQGLLFWLGNGSGTPVGYANWYIGEPNDTCGSGVCDPAEPSEDYAEWIAAPGTWNDIKQIGDVAGYLVEYSSIPEPSSFFLVTIGLFALSSVSRCRRR